jgi:DNA recombination protein RmuC
VLAARAEEQQARFQSEKTALETAEKRLTEAFERLAGKVFDERSQRFTELSEKQLDTLLKPLTKDIETFRKRVDETHVEEQKSHAQLRERLGHLETLNQRLNEEAHNLTRALTADVKAQGGWGEQQLERLLELSGLRRGEHYHTQYSVTGRGGERLQPDVVLMLPENRTIVLDSKVSLTAWTRLQAAADDAAREVELVDHVRSIRAHIDGLAAKNYTGVEELNALDFVLMFIPVEAALIAALHHDPTLPEYALKKRVALLSPANFLATVRTVASVWMVHKQNTNARDIAERAGLLYDKFHGFVDNLKNVGMRLDQAQKAYENAFGQLSTGSGNLVRQAQLLSDLGAKHSKQLEENLLERAVPGDES